MTAKRLAIILGVSLVALMLGLIGGTYVLTKALKSESAKLAVNKSTVEQLTAQEKGISKSKQDIAKYTPLETITKSIVPQDKNQAATVRELINIAGASKVPLTSITFPSSTLGAGSTSTATPSAAASAAAAAKPNLSQLTPVKGLPGVYNLQITVSNNATNTVTYNQLISFLKGLENNRRTAAVRSINIQPQTGQPNQLVFTLIINTYIKP